jgi:hypothetical protein
MFGFVLEGSARLDYRDGFELGQADAFVVPPDDAWSLGAMSDDFRLLQVTTGKMDLAAGD